MPREFACRCGKISYRTPQAAYRDLIGIAKQRNGRAENGIYHCPHCGWWHMTHAHKNWRDRDVDDHKKNRRRWRVEIDLPGLLTGENAPAVFEIQDDFASWAGTPAPAPRLGHRRARRADETTDPDLGDERC